MSNSEPNAMPDQRSITDQLIDIVRVAERAGYYDGADWIKRQVMAQTDRKIAEAGEPRECRQTVNVFGHPLAMPCEQMRIVAGMGDPHEKSRNYCTSSQTDCLHHEPLYAVPSDPPAPEPSRSDAVKEAVRLVAEHVTCRNEGEVFCRRESSRVCGARFRSLIAAFADAERKLADAEDRLRDTGESHAATDKVVFDLYDKLAAAEQRAKNAEADKEAVGTLYLNADRRNEALIRKLVTAREQFLQIESIDCACDGCRGYVRTMAQRGLAAIDASAAKASPVVADYVDIVFDGPPSHVVGRFVECESPAGVGVKVGEWIDRGDGCWALRIPRTGASAAEEAQMPYRTCEQILCLAVSAIGAECTLHRDPSHSRHIGVQAEWTGAPPPDVPAGEERVGPSDWCLAVTCSSCGARCQRKIGHGFGVPHAGACAANCRNAPPPESANIPVPANGAHPFGACCPMSAPPFCPCPCHTNPVAEPVTNVLLDALTEPANAQGSEAAVVVDDYGDEAGCAGLFGKPYPPAFAAEELTPKDVDEALLIASEIASNQPEFRAMNDLVLRLARTCKRLLDRGDALERAAEEAVEAYNTGDALRRLNTIRNLESVLAQRAKGRQ